MKKKNGFTGQLGFVFAAAGSAVGIGNIWRFPYLAAKDGGGVFLVIYLILILTVGFTLLTTDIAIGRKTGMSAIHAYESMRKKWKFLGVITFLVPVLIIPVLMLLYPPAIVLIVLSLFGCFFHNERRVFIAAMSATLTTALLDFFRALIPFLNSASAFGQALALVDAAAGRWLPLYEAGLGWVLPAVIGFAVGLILCRIKPKNA